MEILNIKQAAALLQMHPITLTKKAKAGIIPAAKPGKRWLFLKSHLVDFLRGNFNPDQQKQNVIVKEQRTRSDVVITPTKSEYLKVLGLSDCPQIHSPTPDRLRGDSHARAADRVAKGKAVELVGKSRTCHNRPADDVKA